MIKKYDEFIVEAKNRETLKFSEEDKNKIIEYSNDKILPLLDEDGFRCRFKWVKGKVESKSILFLVSGVFTHSTVKEDIGDILELIIDNDNRFSKELLVDKLEDLVEYLKDENMVFLRPCSYWGDEYCEEESLLRPEFKFDDNGNLKCMCYLYFG
jgi:hypothetical protein